MKELLEKIAKPKWILLFFVLYCVLSLYAFPAALSKIKSPKKEEVKILDTRLHYSVRDVETLFLQLGPEGRATYASVASGLDMVYPLVYGILFVLVLAFLLQQVVKPRSPLLYLSLLPLLGVLFDYLENFNTLSLLRSYPQLSVNDVVRGEGLTRTKWSVLFFCFLIVLFLLIKWGVEKLSKRKAGRAAHFA